MLFIIILFVLLFLSFFLYRKRRHPAFAGLVLVLVIFFAVECCIYTQFIIRILRGDAMALIGNQLFLDNLYKFRLIYALDYSKGKKDYYYVTDEELGYSIGRNKNRGNYTSNSFGLRGTKEYTLLPSKNILRIACFGDSFTFCDNVKDTDSWQYVLENSVGNLEVLNFGVSGYGIGQAYLRYLRDGLRFYPQIIIFNKLRAREDRDTINYPRALNDNMRVPDLYRVKFWIENDNLRYKAANVFDFFSPEFRKDNIYSKYDFLEKNKFLSSKLFSFSNTALLFKTTYMKYKIAQMSKSPDSDRVDFKKISFKILKDLYRHARMNNGTIIFMTKICPFEEGPEKEWEEAFENDKKHIKFFYAKDFTSKYSKELNPENKSILDGTKHHNALGNQMVAKAILDILKNNEWDAGDVVFYYDKKSNSFLSRPKM